MIQTKYVPLGALVEEGGVRFRVWAPMAERVDLLVEDSASTYPMGPVGEDYFECFVPGLEAGARYRYRLDGERALPDPASRFQPDGVHGASMVVDPDDYEWRDGFWSGIDQEDLVFYELHVGTFTPEGTFDGLQRKLGYLKELGVTALELMPVADFPGRWNWGYDPAALYAPSRAYGTPDSLRALVDAAHNVGLAVFLDVIYNHLGPDGAYAPAFMPIFTDKHQTPWGNAINFDDELSEGVRNFFIDNALHWLQEYHLDGLRLDAIHAIIDDSDTHFLAELSKAVHEQTNGAPRLLIGEDERNLNKLVQPRNRGGMGLDGIWADDFHHLIRNITAGDEEGYFQDFAGATMRDVAETLKKGWFYDGKVQPSTGEPRGTDASTVRHDQCVLCIQNHDQVGNRPAGDRITDTIPLPVYRAITAILLFAPELPLLFQGQEWAATTPFQYFTDHNEELGKLVTEGRKEEFQDFEGFGGEVPDPQDPATFERSRLDWGEKDRPPHAGIWELYRRLLALRPDLDDDFEAHALNKHTLHLRRGPVHCIAAVRDGERVPVPEGLTMSWSTEDTPFSENPQPPEQDNGTLHFPAPAAAFFNE